MSQPEYDTAEHESPSQSEASPEPQHDNNSINSEQSVGVSGDVSDDETEIATDDDSAASLKDFIVDDDESDDVSAHTSDNSDIEDHDTALESVVLPILPDEVPTEEETKLAESVTSTVFIDGVRRSTRARKPVVRYVDEEFVSLMLADVDTDAVMKSGSSENDGSKDDGCSNSDNSDCDDSECDDSDCTPCSGDSDACDDSDDDGDKMIVDADAAEE